MKKLTITLFLIWGGGLWAYSSGDKIECKKKPGSSSYLEATVVSVKGDSLDVKFGTRRKVYTVPASSCQERDNRSVQEKNVEYYQKQTRSDIVKTYNNHVDSWKKKKRSGSYTGESYSREIQSKSFIPDDEVFELKTGKMTKKELVAYLKSLGGDAQSECITKEEEALQKTGEAGKLFQERGQPDFSNYYCSKSSYILWVYKKPLPSEGVLLQEIYHIHPKTGKIIERKEDRSNKL
ncbi:MAG: hypothetical protein H7A24_04655 [Leptospiraceae bacterium]|nr:hypothetical protein [Leptospiraceae bacterium]MCP5511147.1 hypothetical protein [Leptospiraceae bacterium]